MRTTGSGRACAACCASATGSRSSVRPASREPRSTSIEATRPDIVVLDPRLPDVDGGLSFIARVRALGPGVRILVMSGTDPVDQDRLAVVADGFVRKTFRPTDLVAAVTAAAAQPSAG